MSSGTSNNPYTAPAAEPHPTPNVGLQGPYGAFRKNGTLKNVIVAFLVLDAMMCIFNTGILNYMDMRQYEDASYLATDETSELDSVIQISALSQVALNVTLIVLFCVWMNRSCKNAWLLDPPRMTTTPGWSVGYFFIPILMLWKPYSSMKEIRSASYGKDHPLKSVMPLWWTLWLITSFIGNITFRLYASADPDKYLMASKLDLVATPLNVILNYLAITLVTGITLAQERRLVHWHQ